jgi:hypothetical protein
MTKPADAIYDPSLFWAYGGVGRLIPSITTVWLGILLLKLLSLFFDMLF